MVRRTAVLTLSLLAIGLSGCPKDDPQGNNGVINANNGNNGSADTGPDAAADMGGGDSANNGEADAGMNNNVPDVAIEDAGLDFNVSSEGEMHGNWEVRRAADNALFASLRLRHNAGETQIVGTFVMEEPPGSGTLAGTNWVNDQFNASWVLRVDGTNEQFTVNSAVKTDADHLTGRCNNSLEGSIVDCTMTRTP